MGGNLAGLPHLMHALALQSKQIMGLRQKAEVSVINWTFRVDDVAPFFCTTKTYLPWKLNEGEFFGRVKNHEVQKDGTDTNK